MLQQNLEGFGILTFCREISTRLTLVSPVAQMGSRSRLGIGVLCIFVPLSSYNQGCGAFGGNRKMKALVQLMAAAQSRRSLSYANYGAQDILGLPSLHASLQKYNVTVGEVARYLSMQVSEKKDRGWQLGPIESVLEEILNLRSRNE